MKLKHLKEKLEITTLVSIFMVSIIAVSGGFA